MGGFDGTLSANTTGSVIRERVTTSAHLPQDLYSIDKKFYEDNFSLLITQADFTVPCEWCGLSTRVGNPRLAKVDMIDGQTKEQYIPISTDRAHGGFWVDYWVDHAPTGAAYGAASGMVDTYEYHDITQALAMIARAVDHEAIIGVQHGEPDDCLDAQAFNVQDTNQPKPNRNNAVKEFVIGREAWPGNIRGVKATLRPNKQKMSEEEFHCEHSHIGSCSGCRICAMLKGSMRRIFRIIDAYVEHRRAYAWVMDTVTINTRSLCGARFMICLRCKATCYIVVLFLWRKSESAMVIEQWINSLRSDPMMQGMGYPAVQYIETDNAGEWSRGFV